MKSVFADTSFYLAFLSPRDPFHEAAVQWVRQLQGTIVTTEHFLIETGNMLSRSRARESFVRFVERLRTDPDIVIIPASPRLFDIGFDLYAARADKTWSLTDCISFAVMKEQGLTEALTADHHFEQAGFKMLLE